MTAHFTEDELVTQLVGRGVPHAKAILAAAKETLVRQAEPPSKAKRRANTRKAKAVHKVNLEAKAFKILCQREGLPLPVTDYQFAASFPVPDRCHLELDYAWPNIDTPGGYAIEVQGGIWRKGGGAHTGRGHVRDMKKLNLAQRHGWRVDQLQPKDLNTLATIHLVRQALTPSPSETK